MGLATNRLLTISPRYAAAGVDTGVVFDPQLQVARNLGRFLEKYKRGVSDSAKFQSSLRFVVYRANAFDIRLGDTRRTLCAGFAACLFFTFWSQLESRFAPPTIDSLPRQMAPGNASADEEFAEVRDT